MVLVKCKRCGKEYQLEKGENPSDFQCECGGNLLRSRASYDSKASSGKRNSDVFDSWNKQKFSTKIIIAAVGLIVVFGIIALISGVNQPTFEDKLIEGYQKGTSQPVLEDYIAAHTRALTVTLQKNTEDPNLLAEELQNVKAIETFQIMYIKEQITAQELKDKTYPLYQQYNDLKDLIHLTGF